MRLRYKVLTTAIVLGGVFLWGRCGKNGRNVAPTPNVLPKNDTEQIKVNPGSHTLTIITPSGQKTVTLPDRTSTIDVLKSGQVKITSPQFGFEHHVFLGFQASDRGRLTAGMDGWYFKKLDLGVGVADSFGAYAPIIYAKASYNVWRSVQAGLTYDNLGHPGLALTIRL